jgi:hypothetical protein
MKARGKMIKRKRGPRMTFGELVQKLWQPEPEEPDPKVAPNKQRKAVARAKPKRKG